MMICGINGKKWIRKPGMVVQTPHTSTLGTEGRELKASLGYKESLKLALETVSISRKGEKEEEKEEE